MEVQLATSLLSVVVAITISMSLIPVLIHLAPRLGMMDKPDARKVHVTPIPRVGGVGIVLGALVPMAILLPWDNLIVSYLLGSVVLLVFGIWDDVKELGHYVKFFGQIIAVVLVVYHGDLYITRLPFMGLEPIGETFGRLFTVVAMIGVINAINHSDGLDGLAGGESLLSLGAVCYLGYQAEDPVVVLIAMATMGGIFGFLRFNSHPARVFMGDGGSQFLGFTLAFLVPYLLEVSNTALSPALPALLLGLPVLDILFVLFQRIKSRVNIFKASKNHVHHRLLELGFRHYESVMVIYSIQAMLVVTGVLVPYESDGLIVAIYLLVCAALFGGLWLSEARGWHAHQSGRQGPLAALVAGFRTNGQVLAFNYQMIRLLLSVFLISGMLMIESVPKDMALASFVLFLTLMLRLLFGYRLWFLFLRLILYVSVAFVAYLLEFHPLVGLEWFQATSFALIGVLAIGVVLAVRFSEGEFFRATPLDYLMLLVVVVLVVMAQSGYADVSIIKMVLELMVLFYAVEVTLKHMSSRLNVFTVSALIALGGLAVRGWIN